MDSRWSRFESLILPLVITDVIGIIQYKNRLALEMSIVRNGSNISSCMDEVSIEKFKSLDESGELLSLIDPPYVYRNVAISLTEESARRVAMLFPDILLGDGDNFDNERLILDLVP